MGEEENMSSKKTSLQTYWPLFSLILVCLLAASAMCWSHQQTMQAWMHYFMGIFFLLFSALKLFHPQAFADGFVMYDLLAKRCRFYAYIYPLIELSLSLSYLAFFCPTLTYTLTIIILSISSIGVIKALQKGLKINCPCMGTVLDVPLSTVTLTEDISMVVMALFLLIY